VNAALAATGIFPIGGIRSRAIWLDTWQMADGQHDYAFVHMTLKIGAGRSLESRQDVGDMLFTLIKAHFAALMESRYLALSFEIDELHPTLNYKQNNVHALFKERAAGQALSRRERAKRRRLLFPAQQHRMT